MFIYKITNKINGKLYIGQTIQDPRIRWSQHKYKLNKNVHDNRYLQFAWNKYGCDMFVFEVIDRANTLTMLNEQETYYINLYKTTCNDFGYNLKDGGLNSKLSDETRFRIGNALRGKHHSVESKQKRALIRRKTSYPIVVDPNGNEHIILDMTNFCREHNLHTTGMFDLVNKKCRHYKKWRLSNTNLETVDTFDLIAQRLRPDGYPPLKSPDGKIYTGIKNLSKFCKEHNLTVTNMSSVINNRAKSHRGWTIFI